jgi:hypothetical protein
MCPRLPLAQVHARSRTKQLNDKVILLLTLQLYQMHACLMDGDHKICAAKKMDAPRGRRVLVAGVRRARQSGEARRDAATPRIAARTRRRASQPHRHVPIAVGGDRAGRGGVEDAARVRALL